MYTLILSATSTASANGTDTNTATAILMNGNEYVSGKTVEFRLITGSAIFSDGTQIKQATTNSLGEASVVFTDTIEETVTLIAILSDDATVYNTASSEFGGGSTPELKVNRVYNDNNKEFSLGGPHHLFIGAKFYIELSTISASTIWTCDDSNVELANVNGMGHVTIKGTPSSDIINIGFINASGNGRYDVACNLYLDNIHAEIEPQKTPTKSEFLAIYEEWGDMSTFDWGKNGSLFYFYEHYDAYNSYAVDMSNGSVKKHTRELCDSATKLGL